MLSITVSMMVFALIGAVTPGPVNIIATSSGASAGAIKTLPFVLGAACGYTLVVVLVGVGLYPLLIQAPQIGLLLQYLGAGFLLFMAYKIATMPPVTDGQAQSLRIPNIWQGALAQLLNPKAWLVALSGVGLFVAGQVPMLLYLGVFSLISWSMCLLGVAVWAVAGHGLQRVFLRRHGQHFNRMMGLLLSAAVVNLLLN